MGLKEHLPNFGHLDEHTKNTMLGYEIFYEDIKKDMKNVIEKNYHTIC